MKASLIRSAIGLAVVSVILSIIMFRFSAPLAGVFELSVCAGLITVVFMSTISLTKPLTPQEATDASKERMTRFWYLPVILLLLGMGLIYAEIPFTIAEPSPEAETNVRNVLWNLRQIDLLGQVFVLLAGVFGVAVLFKDKPKKN
jgi:NADH-quinone oxidoreductase subunit J